MHADLVILCCLLKFVHKLHLSSHHFSGWPEYKTPLYQRHQHLTQLVVHNHSLMEKSHHTFVKSLKYIISCVYNEVCVPSLILELQWEEWSIHSLQARCFSPVFHFPRNCIKRKSAHNLLQEKQECYSWLAYKLWGPNSPIFLVEKQCLQFQPRQHNYTMLILTTKQKQLLSMKDFTMPDLAYIGFFVGFLLLQGFSKLREIGIVHLWQYWKHALFG